MDKHLENDAALPDGDSSQKSRKSHFLAIDLKSFYASVECVERGLDPLTANLVVADTGRTEKTICLAVSPSLKEHGIPGRPRLFEVIQRVNEINAERRQLAPGRRFSGKSHFSDELEQHPELELSYITATPQMARYMEYSARIYEVYLKYISPDDIHVYSVDEVFMDVTDYLRTYGMTPKELAKTIILDVLETTGITATAGIGTNLYLCKIALDIMAKHIPADENGVRIAELNEKSYRENLWNHRPLTDFWRIGRGYQKKLEQNGLMTMGDIARCSGGKDSDYYNEDFLYKLFGKNTELLIDHAWGWEPCGIADIKAFRPASNSLSAGQVLHVPYDFKKTAIIVREMTDQLVLELVEKRLVTDQMTLTIGYDSGNLSNGTAASEYDGEVTTDRYGRRIPKHAHGTANISVKSSSSKRIVDAVMELYERIMDKRLLVRRVTVVANNVVPESEVRDRKEYEQLSLFTDYSEIERQRAAEEKELQKERKLQEAMLSIRKKYGKNAVLKGTNLQEGATARERNEQIGGHKA